MKQTLQFTHNCKNNSSKNPLVVDVSRGEVVCNKCGLVLKEKIIDPSAEKVSWNIEDSLANSRTGGLTKLSIYDRGLSSQINLSNKDSHGNRLTAFTKNQFGRLRIWDSRTKQTNKARNLTDAFIILDGMKVKLNLSENIIEKTAYLYRKAVTRKIIRGRTKKGILLASLYAACRESKTPRSLQEIAKKGNINKKNLSKDYRALLKALELRFEPNDPIKFLNKIASRINVTQKTIRIANQVLHDAKKKRITASKKPQGIAGAAIYLAGLIRNEKISYSKISFASGISSVTLRKLVRILISRLGNESYLASIVR